MVGSLRFCGSDIAESIEISKREMVMDEKKIYVAVTGKDLESKSSLVWAIQNSGGKEFCIVYVHQPIQISVRKKFNSFINLFVKSLFDSIWLICESCFLHFKLERCYMIKNCGFIEKRRRKHIRTWISTLVYAGKCRFDCLLFITYVLVV